MVIFLFEKKKEKEEIDDWLFLKFKKGDLVSLNEEREDLVVLEFLKE